MNETTCIAEGCVKPSGTRRMCSMHYAREYRASRTEDCGINACGRKVYAKGLCTAHYQRSRKYGSPLVEAPRASAAARLAEHSVRDGECLTWTGHTTEDGYGRIRVDGSMPRAHRVAWTLENGPIPAGSEVDHTCWNRACINVEHLRLASRTENVRNREGANSNSETGVRGVHWDPARRSYRAQVGRKYLGRFADLDEAASAVSRARAKAYGTFAGN